MPVDLLGTGFQQRVWDALMKVPEGETVSYAGLARQLGAPRAARAAARARAHNRIAVVVPCHRVIRGDGSLGGYRWGLPRKQQLLARERVSKAPIRSSRARHWARMSSTSCLIRRLIATSPARS